MDASEGVELPGYRQDSYYYDSNFSCDLFYLPTTIQLFESLGNFGVGLVTIASVMCAATVYLGVDACSSLCYRKESSAFKINACTILSVYPIASLCSLVALALPRSQLLSEGLTSVALAMAFNHLYLLLTDLGRRSGNDGRPTKPPAMALRVGPCCCWPCLPLPTLETTDANLAWLRITVLQFPLVQGLVYVGLLVVAGESPSLAATFQPFLVPLMMTSILFAVYGLTVVTKSLHEIAPEANLAHKTTVVQMVLLFSKLQGFLIKGLVGTGLFPCNPPLTAHAYAHVTYNALMVIEMLMLCYAARLIYAGEDHKLDAANHELEAPPVAPPRAEAKNGDAVAVAMHNGAP